MTSSAPPSQATTRSNTLGCGELSSWRRSLRIREIPNPKPQIPSPNAGWSQAFGAVGIWDLGFGYWDFLHAYSMLLLGVAGERVLGRLRRSDDFRRGRLAGEGALDGFLRRRVVVVVDLLIVGRVPVDEDADHDAVVIQLVLRNDARLDGVDHSAGHGRLGGTEHLHRLLR